MVRFIVIAACLVLTSLLPSITAFAQSDAGQDVYDARGDSQDEWNTHYCDLHKDDAGCKLTPEKIKKQEEADIAVPTVIISLFIGWIWIRKKLNRTNNG